MIDTLKPIETFINKHHLLSLATLGERLWCASMFYAYNTEETVFIVASDPDTEHMGNVLQNIDVAGTVALETKTVGKIQGIQFRGEMTLCNKGSDLYFKVFPFARVMNPTLWTIRLDEIKMTDNTLGFGKKLIWMRES